MGRRGAGEPTPDPDLGAAAGEGAAAEESGSDGLQTSAGESGADPSAVVPAGVYTEEELAAHVTAAPEGDPLRPVKVKNNGGRAWVGSDFALVGTGVIGPGAVGTVTWKKAQQLIADFGAGLDGLGPFEIVEE